MSKHKDAAALDRLGYARVHGHFNITRQAFAYWRKHGVPKPHRKSLVMLGALNGVAVPEFLQERDNA